MRSRVGMVAAITSLNTQGGVMRARPLLSAVLTVCTAASAFGGPSQDAEQSPSGMRIVVDGATSPERIPDHVAIGMFMTSIAIPADADTRALAVMQVKIAPMRLSRSDVAILRGELAGLHRRLAAQKEVVVAGLGNAAKPTPRQAVGLINAQHSLAMDSYTRLLEILSREGRTKLVAHIARVKTQMKAVGPKR